MHKTSDIVMYILYFMMKHQNTFSRRVFTPPTPSMRSYWSDEMQENKPIES